MSVAGDVVAAQPGVRAPTLLRVVSGLLRTHQWVKNVLVFVPAVAAHARGVEAFRAAGLAFVALCLAASSAYVVNDLLDLENDRRNPARAGRPIAAGWVSPRTAVAAAAALLVAGLWLSLAALPPAFSALLAGYWAASIAYSLKLKRVPVLDVIVLAGLYAVRVLGGTLATGIPTSTWLFTFAIFLFFSLALVKRVSGLQALPPGETQAAGRGYRGDDIALLTQVGVASGLLAVLVLALYISHPDVTRLYEHNERLWLLCPLGLYWESRLWLLTHRGQVHEDPVVFALRDRPSYLVGLAALAVVYLAI
jgi:4-hydroxybenzoate polyprenyltransferase